MGGYFSVYQGANVCTLLHTLLFLHSPLLEKSLVSSALSDQLGDILHELLVGSQLLQTQVHAIAPVVLWIGWDVDTLGIGIRQAEVFIDGKPVLNAQYAEHGWRGEMAGDDVSCQPAWERMRSRSFTIEHRVVILLGAGDVLVPPHTQGRHIMAGDGAD